MALFKHRLEDHQVYTARDTRSMEGGVLVISRQVRIHINLFRSGQWGALLGRKVNYIGEACLGESKEKTPAQDVLSKRQVSVIYPISSHRSRKM